MCDYVCSIVFFFKQKTAYEMRISDWSSDVCSSDLLKEFEARRAELEKLQAEKLAAAQKVGEKLSGSTITVAQKAGVDGRLFGSELGRASCRERVCQYV